LVTEPLVSRATTKYGPPSASVTFVRDNKLVAAEGLASGVQGGILEPPLIGDRRIGRGGGHLELGGRAQAHRGVRGLRPDQRLGDGPV